MGVPIANVEQHFRSIAGKDLQNAILIVRMEALNPELRQPDFQFFLAQRGKGCSPNCKVKDTRIYGVLIKDGRSCCFNRSDIIAGLAYRDAPSWVKTNATRIRKLMKAEQDEIDRRRLERDKNWLMRGDTAKKQVICDACIQALSSYLAMKRYAIVTDVCNRLGMDKRLSSSQNLITGALKYLMATGQIVQDEEKWYTRRR